MLHRYATLFKLTQAPAYYLTVLNVYVCYLYMNAWLCVVVVVILLMVMQCKTVCFSFEVRFLDILYPHLIFACFTFDYCFNFL